MNAIRGTFLKGTIVPDVPPDWAEGTRVDLEPVALTAESSDELPDDDDSSPEAIAKRLALMDRVEPWMTPEEDAEWRRQRAEQKAMELAGWDKWTKDLEKHFQ